jgi:hypothetical protein
MNLIGQGELLRATRKQFAETIVFVPFYFGKKENMKRHAQFANELGFDCVIFNLTSNLVFAISKFLPNILNGWGIKHLWTQEILKILDAVDGEKILFAFSNPSSSALEAAEIRKAKDIKAIICDGGPFYDLLMCNWNFFAKEFKIPTLPGKIAANAFARSIWSIEHEKELEKSLNSLPKKFPVMSIRGWQDHLVPPTAIEKAFHGHDQIDLEILNLPQGGHMDGLKKFPEVYKPRVEAFLKSVGTKV